MRAGTLRRMIEVQRFDEAAINEYGTPSPDWTSHAKLRAEIVKRSTEEFIENQGARDEAVTVFRTRWHPDVTTADRVLHDGTTYNLKEVVEIGRRKGLELRGEAVA